MADSLNTNPIVIDLQSSAASRQIKSGQLFVKNILVSGADDGANAPTISIRNGSATGAKQFQYTAAIGTHQRSDYVDGKFENPFFVNDDGNVWAADAVMLIYLA